MSIQRINRYPVDSVVCFGDCFGDTYPLDTVIQPSNNRGQILGVKGLSNYENNAKNNVDSNLSYNLLTKFSLVQPFSLSFGIRISHVIYIYKTKIEILRLSL